MTHYLLDSSPLTAYIRGRLAAVELIDPWIVRREVVTTLISYGEVTEYNRSFTDAIQRQDELRRVLDQIAPLPLDYAIMERYADLRRRLRPPYGPDLIGDIDTLIAATALEHNLTLVTTDTDYQRVPDLKLELLPRKM